MPKTERPKAKRHDKPKVGLKKRETLLLPAQNKKYGRKINKS